MKKRFVLTIDYEVFLGRETAPIEETLIKPTNKLLDILDINKSKMTVFWDILHYYAICQNCNEYPELYIDKKLIEDQIKNIVLKGHDVQMHIHPHWLDAKFENHKWIFRYDRFSIQKLERGDNVSDINSIYGCLTMSKRIMEDFIQQYDSTYKVTSYRAGGYLIEPFAPLITPLNDLGIYIDSSTCPEAKSHKREYSFDFSNYPNKLQYHFSNTPKIIDNKGSFIELPIYILKLSLFDRLRIYMYRKFYAKENKTYPFLGKGVDFGAKKTSLFQYLKNKFGYTTVQLSTDGTNPVLYKFVIEKAPNNAVMILHPKMQNELTFNLLEKDIKDNTIRFVSIKDILRNV